MIRNIIQKLIIITIIGIILFFLSSIYFSYKLYRTIFRLSYDQVSSSLNTTISQCNKIGDCKLSSGDILIRRYITSKTRPFDEFVHPYFTHSAFYLADDQIIEAIGTEKNPQDEIKISKFSENDWLNSDIESFVIVRPKYNSDKLKNIKMNLTAIANDPNYKFGLPQFGYKQTTCADLIFEQLLKEEVISVSTLPKIITPDYIFWLAVTSPNSFEIIGYNFSK